MAIPAFDPMSMEYTSNPQSFFPSIHDHGPVFYYEPLDAWMVYGYAEAKIAIADKRFSRNRDDWTNAPSEDEVKRWPLLTKNRTNSPFINAERHRAHRALFTNAFKPSAIRRMDSIIQDVVNQFLEPIKTEKEIDLTDLLVLIPSTVISRIVGIPRDDGIEARFRDAAGKFMQGISPLADEASFDIAEIGMTFIYDSARALIDKRRIQPEEDLISDLIVGAEASGGTDEDIIFSLASLLSAGIDTTRHGAGMMIKAVMEQPEVFNMLSDNRDLLDDAPLEFLRNDFPAKFLVRFATQDVEFGETVLPKGGLTLISIHGAGWDSHTFGKPEDLAFTRDPKRYLTFGHGDTYCLGAHLAKFQLKTILEYMLDNLPEGASYDEEKLVWEKPDLILRGIKNFPVTLRS